MKNIRWQNSKIENLARGIMEKYTSVNIDNIDLAFHFMYAFKEKEIQINIKHWHKGKVYRRFETCRPITKDNMEAVFGILNFN